MFKPLKLVLAVAYASAIAAGTYMVYSATKRDDYTPTTNSMLTEEGELKSGTTLKYGEDNKFNFRTTDHSYTLRVYCPKSEIHNPEKTDCTAQNKMQKMVLIRNPK